MAIRIYESEKKISPRKLAAVEQKLSIKLPKEYRDFLLSHNGGRPEPDGFLAINDRGEETDSCVDWFLAIYNGEDDNFEDNFRAYKIEDVRLPDELVPIATDPGGNLICIAVDGPKCGAVYFWDHEMEAGTGEKPSYDNVYLIANSFNAFVDSLSDS
jgi:cell wall assembly regulator SMI1